MQTPLEIGFKHVTPSVAIKSLIKEKAGHLETVYGGFTSCHVYVRGPHESQRRGNLIEVTIVVRVPGTELVVRHDQNDAPEHQITPVAVRDAFAAMAIELNRWRDRRDSDVKALDGQTQGTVVEIRHDRDFDQIIATDNRRIYVHRSSVVDGSFDARQPGDPPELVVRSRQSELGSQASMMRRIRSLADNPATKPSRR